MNTADDLLSVFQPETVPAVRVTEPEVDSDGFICNSAGEIIGHVNDREGPFQVTDRESAEWALELRSKVEGDHAAITARQRAVNEQFESQKAAVTRRLAWWDWRFRAPLVAFAKTLLKGKSRTAVLDWGRVSFRTTPGSSTVIDDAAALAYVKLWSPASVKVVESVGVKAVLAAKAAAEAATGEPEGVLPFLATSEPGENVEVSTGIEMKEGKR